MKKFGALINLSYAFGAMLSLLLGLALPDDGTKAQEHTEMWRLVFGFPIILNVMQLILFGAIFRLDSPKYYIASGDRNLAA